MPQSGNLLCIKCDDPLPEFDYVVCTFCNGKLHYECAGVRESNWRKCNNELKKNWKCYQCRQRQDMKVNGRGGDIPKTSSGNIQQNVASKSECLVSKSYPDASGMVSPVIESLKVIVKQLMKEELTEMKRKMIHMETMLDTFSEKQKDLCNVTGKLTKEYSKLKTECDQLLGLNRKIDAEISEIKKKAEEMKCSCSLQKIPPKDYLTSESSNPSISSRKCSKSHYNSTKRLSLIPVRPNSNIDCATVQRFDSNKDFLSFSSVKLLSHIYDYEAFGRYICNEISSLNNDKYQRKLRLDIIKLCLDYHDREESESFGNISNQLDTK